MAIKSTGKKTGSSKLRAGILCKYCFLFATIFAICFMASGFADDARISHVVGANWYACEDVNNCAWVIGEGGWPVAVGKSSVPAYLEWVQSQAPFTTYFTPEDCFEKDEEFEAYVLQSKSRVSCAARHCALATEPVCTR